jgi:hypothetical protein
MTRRRGRRAVRPAIEGLEGRELKASTGGVSAFQIQELMSSWNQQLNLASNVAKARAETEDDIIHKLR